MTLRLWQRSITFVVYLFITDVETKSAETLNTEEGSAYYKGRKKRRNCAPLNVTSNFIIANSNEKKRTTYFAANLLAL